MSRLIYSIVFAVLSPLFVFRLFWRSLREPSYRYRWWQRFAIGLPARTRPGEGLIWIHAVSLGELLAVAPLIERLLLEHPQKALLVTNTTPTGAAQTKRLFGDRVEQCWFPFDIPLVISRFLRHWQPELIVMVETEIWPNVLAAAHASNIPTVLLNARLSARSARGYARFIALTRQTLERFSAIACQSQSDQRRFKKLGAESASLHIVGSMKFDIDLANRRDQLGDIKQQLGDAVRQQSIWAAASTHPGEEVLVLNALEQLKSLGICSLLLLAPRHPNRSPEIIRLLEERSFSYQMRSDGESLRSETDVLLIDTLGELSAFLGLASVAFIGGSLVPRGGHNPIEAAAWGCTVLTGPHVTNFASIVRDMERSDAITTIESEQALCDQLQRAWPDNEGVEPSDSAKQFVDSRRGATRRQLDILESFLI